MNCGEVCAEQNNLSDSVCEMAVTCFVSVSRDFKNQQQKSWRAVVLVVESEQMPACVQAYTHKEAGFGVYSGSTGLFSLVDH